MQQYSCLSSLYNIPYLFTYKPSYFFRNLDLNLPNFFSKKGVRLIAESLGIFFLLRCQEQKEMSRDRLVAKSELKKHNKYKLKLLVNELL